MNLEPQPLVSKRDNSIIATLIFIGTLVIYMLTLARSLSFWDAGEYITCSSILGIPHPPGNPFYILLGRFFTILGIGVPHAQLVNFMSAVFASLAVMFTYLFTVKLISMWLQSPKQAYKAYLGGFLAAFYTAFSYTFWTNAIEAEVYAGLAFIINLIVWLTLVWVEKSRDFSHQNILLLIIYVFFLGFGIHQTSLQIAPAVLFIVVYPLLRDNIGSKEFWNRFIIYIISLVGIYLIFNYVGKELKLPALSKYMFALGSVSLMYYHLKEKFQKQIWLLGILFIVIGLSSHIFLLVRSELRPFINEGNPHNLSMFLEYVLRKQYGSTSMFVRRASFIYQLKDQFLKYFSWQFFNTEILSYWLQLPQRFIQFLANFVVILLGFGGAYYQYKKNKHSFAYMFSLFFMASLAMVFVINLSDAEVRERDYFFTTAYNFWAVWLAIGSLAVVQYFKKHKKILGYLAIIFVITLPTINLLSQYNVHDRSEEYIALDYGQNILNSLEKNAIIFTNGDNDTFPGWYAQAVYDPKASEFIPETDNEYFPDEQAKAAINRAMAYKNEQCRGIRKDITIANLSLLNTGWYIKQLRDLEGVIFELKDRSGKPLPMEQQNKLIEGCDTMRSSPLAPKIVPDDISLPITTDFPDQSFVVNFPKDKILYTKDLAVLQIIKDNYGKRPIYFAVTVGDVVGFEKYLKNEGMVDRLVTQKSEFNYDIDRITTNIDSVYSYRGIFDKRIYKDSNMARLLNNYGASFMRASQYYHQHNDYINAIKYMKRGMEFIQQKQRFNSSLARLYLEYSYQLIENDSTKAAFDNLEKAVSIDPNNQYLPGIISEYARITNDFERAKEILEKTNLDSSLKKNFFERMKP
jgi:hypothetical protein